MKVTINGNDYAVFSDAKPRTFVAVDSDDLKAILDCMNEVSGAEKTKNQRNVESRLYAVMSRYDNDLKEMRQFKKSDKSWEFIHVPNCKSKNIAGEDL